MAGKDFPVTPAVRFLKAKNIDFVPHIYDYEEKGGTRQTAEVLNVPEHNVVKTLVMEDESGNGMLVLMHGDFEVSTKELARTLSVKTIKPCNPDKATKLTGYQFGGTSPFGTLKNLPVLAENSIFALDKIYINCGKRGFIAEMPPDSLKKAFAVTEVNVAINK